MPSTCELSADIRHLYLSPNALSLRLFRPLMPFIHKLGPPAFRRKLIDILPHAGLKRMRDISDEIQYHSRHIYETKKRAMREGDAAVMQQIGEGKDIMSKLSMYATVRETACGIDVYAFQCKRI